jgi:proline iminopeptidase
MNPGEVFNGHTGRAWFKRINGRGCQRYHGLVSERPHWKTTGDSTMHRIQWIALTSLLSICLDASARETVLDRIIEVQQSILEVPEVARLEAGLDLDTKRIDVGGASLYVEEEGAGVPLVLINGGPGGTHHYFHPWFSRASDYARVIYYDQRGTGLSDFRPGEGGYSVEQAVDDLDRLRQALGIDTWVMLGYSYGGFLAQYYATTHPEHVAGLVLVGSLPGLWAELGDSRQHDYMSEVEKERIRSVQKQIVALGKENDWPRETLIQKIIFNNFINGDWKRQSFYKPTPDEIALIARYEWVNERGFNGAMNRSAERVNLAGAFERSPFQTLILEGKWDLTWGEEKPAVLAGNHPRARFLTIDNAGHAIFSENPGHFFSELEKFMRNLAPVSAQDLALYQRDLAAWRKAWQESPRYVIRDAGPGKRGSEQIMAGYASEWLEQVSSSDDLRRLGFALYEHRRFDDALVVFSKLEQLSVEESSETDTAMALIWQGHILDMMNRRDEAVARYQQVAAMNLGDGMQHDQYEMDYVFSAYAEERIQAPFAYVENRLP